MNDTGVVEVITLVEIALASGTTDFGEPVTITLSYSDGLVDGTSPPIPESELSVWILEDAEAGDGVPIWNRMVRPDDNVAVAEVTHTGTFGLLRPPLLCCPGPEEE